jgi:hypothetical protein
MESILPCDDLLGAASHSVARCFDAPLKRRLLATKLPLSEWLSQWELLGLQPKGSAFTTRG